MLRRRIFENENIEIKSIGEYSKYMITTKKSTNGVLVFNNELGVVPLVIIVKALEQTNNSSGAIIAMNCQGAEGYSASCYKAGNTITPKSYSYNIATLTTIEIPAQGSGVAWDDNINYEITLLGN